jgi:hypothetical protein
MSTNSYARPLYSVPDVSPGTKARFALLLALRDAARRALDKVLSLPRSAIGWAIDLFHRWVEASGSVGLLSWFGGQARNAAGLVREVGIVPSLVALLSTPPIAAAAARAARFVGRGIASIASTAWAGLKGLLGRCGSTGARIVEGLSKTGAEVMDAVRGVAEHPMMAPVVHALQATLALVRPISQGFVAHRLLRTLVPIVWLRLVFELLVMPFVMDSSLAGNVRDAAEDHHTDSDQTKRVGAHADLLVNTGTDAPTPSGHAPDHGAEQADHAQPTMNRASRRAQQREDAQAKRSPNPRR